MRNEPILGFHLFFNASEVIISNHIKKLNNENKPIDLSKNDIDSFQKETFLKIDDFI